MKPSHRGASSIKLFNTTYSRSCYFKLDKILDKEGEIKNGHVLLGFTKDGQFLISYSLMIDNNFDSPEPQYFYTLHWWRFNFNNPLVKEHSEPLFSRTQISEDLHIIISESLDGKQFIIWGRSVPDAHEQSCVCHVTICPAPPSKPCRGCKELRDIKCINHCYAVHFRYDSLPPYPTFLPSVSLQIPGTILLNCGDHLVAMKCVPCAVYSQVERALKDFKVRPPIDPDMTTQDLENIAECRRKNAWLDAAHIGNEDCESSSDDEYYSNSLNNSEAIMQGSPTLKKNDNELPASNDASILPMKDGSSPSAKRLNRDKQLGDTSSDSETVLLPFSTNCASGVDGTNDVSQCRSHNHVNRKDCNNYSCIVSDTENNNDNGIIYGTNNGGPDVKGVSHDDDNDANDDDDNIKNCSNSNKSIQDSSCVINASNDLQNDNNNDRDGYSSRSSDNDTNNNTNPTKFTFRTYCYTETYIREDDSDADANREITALFITCNGEPVNSCSNTHRMTEPSVLICQAFLGIEECINELLQSHHELRDRYKSLRDYDCQYMSACPETGDVIIMIKVLISAKRTRSCCSQGLPVSPNPSLYQTGFILSWNIWNGHYRTLHYMDVTEYSHTKESTKSISSIEATRKLRKQVSTPTSYRSQVRVFSNHTVFTSQSLKYLVHPFLPIVLVM